MTEPTRTPPWITDRVLTVEIVADVLGRQFPQFKNHAISYLSEGWDFQAYDVDGQWIFRFPKRAEVLR